MVSVQNAQIAVIGLGYVGLPLALAFAARFPVTGFDINADRIADLQAGRDATDETTASDWSAAKDIRFTTDPQALRDANTYIVTVPTPVDSTHRPDLGPLLAASEVVGQVIAPGDVVIFESTVYPGATEEDCIPVIERVSGLIYGQDFQAGYSPERINPGDRTHRLADIRKVTSGSDVATATFVDVLYGTIITAGTHLAPSIRVAEAAKVIENVQRDVNIALINELAMIFERMGLDTLDVLEAAGTKWNFQPFRPGLVGGHCIGVDPYYLTHKAQALGYHPQMVLSGRCINDGMGAWLVQRLIREMIARDIAVKGARVLILGLTFKEDVPDLRNTRVIDVKDALEAYGVRVEVHDPLADPETAHQELGITLARPDPGRYDAVVLAVAHAEFRSGGIEALRPLFKEAMLVLDLKGILPREPGVLRV